MKKLYFLMVAVLVTTMSFAQGSEDFTNFAPIGTNYEDGSFVGNNSVTWTYVRGRITDNTNTFGSPNFPAIMLQKSSNNSAVSSSTISGGIGDFSVKLYRGYTNTSVDRQVELFINGVSKGVSVGFTDETEHVFSVTGINIGGNFTIELKSTSSKQIVIDDITWTAYAGAVEPSATITSPTEGEVMATGNFPMTYSISNFNVAAAGMGDGHFHYFIDGTDQGAQMTNTGSIDITGLAAGAHTLRIELRNDDHSQLTPPVFSEVNFTVQAYTQVADIAALRAGTIGDAYELTGEVFINYEQSYRHQKWIQDASAGILIDDNSNNITAGIRGDGLTGLKGTLGEYKGMKQFIPLTDATVASPSNLTITPQVVTLADLTANYENYEAELVKVENVMLDNTASITFENGIIYPMSQGADAFNLRTSLYDGTLMATNVPTVAADVVGLPMEKTGTATGDYGMVMTPRDLADVTVHTASTTENSIKGFAMYPNPVNGNVLNITTAQNSTKNIQIFNILGKQVLAQSINGNTVNVSKLTAGIYLIKVEEAGNFTTRKLVIK